jgi:hypothetical protein
MIVADDRLLLADPHTSRISTTCDQHMQHSIGAPRYCNLMEHHDVFIAQFPHNAKHIVLEVPNLEKHVICGKIVLKLLLPKLK